MSGNGDEQTIRASTSMPAIVLERKDSDARLLEKKYSFPKNKIKVLLLESISQTAIDIFVKEGFQVETVHKLSEDQLVQKIKDVHVIGVRSKTRLTKRVLEAAEKLLAVGCFCIGTDQTDLEVAQIRGVPVFNAPFANTRSVAEMVIAELIVLARKIGDRSAECHNGVWNKSSSNCYEVRGKTLGIIGYGHVGSQLSVMAEAMGMKVMYYDILNKLPLGLARACDSMNQVLKEADFVSLHVPKTPETVNLITATQLNLMKRGSYLVNASRGDVVNVDDLAAALKSGHLGGCAVDVFPYEPASQDEEFKTPLRGCPNTILTPHIGGSTEEAQEKIGVEVSLKLVSFVNTGCTLDAVNFPNVNLPQNPYPTHRILNVHHNVPGVLRDINNVLCNYNVVSQVLQTEGKIGYLIVEVDREVAKECRENMMALEKSIKTRVLF